MKIKKETLILIWAIIVITSFWVYRINIFIPQKIDIIPERIIELAGNFEISNIDENKYVILFELNNDDIAKKEYKNYILGEDIGSKLDIFVVIKKEDGYIKLDTKLESYEPILDVYKFQAYVNKKYISENENIYIYNNDTNELIDLKGDVTDE